jgi:hypothetical protein
MAALVLPVTAQRRIRSVHKREKDTEKKKPKHSLHRTKAKVFSLIIKFPRSSKGKITAISPSLGRRKDPSTDEKEALMH